MTNETKQTAVEWLFNQMFDPTYPALEQVSGCVIKYKEVTNEE